MTIGADVDEVQDRRGTDPQEVVLDDCREITKRAEPTTVSIRGALETPDIIIGLISIGFGTVGGLDDIRYIICRAVPKLEAVPLVVAPPGDSEVARELNLDDTHNSRVEVLECATSIDVGEQIRRFDGVVSSTRASEIVRSRHWWRSFREITSESNVVDMITLTVVGNVGGSAGSENGESTGIIEASGVCETVLDLEAGTDSISARIFRAGRRAIYLSTAERGVRASGICDDEAMFGEGAQDSTGIIEKFEGLIASVEDGHRDLQVLQSVDLDVGDRGHDDQAGSGICDDGRSDENDDSGAKGRGHGNVGGGGAGEETV